MLTYLFVQCQTKIQDQNYFVKILFTIPMKFQFPFTEFYCASTFLRDAFINLHATSCRDENDCSLILDCLRFILLSLIWSWSLFTWFHHSTLSFSLRQKLCKEIFLLLKVLGHTLLFGNVSSKVSTLQVIFCLSRCMLMEA